MQSRFLNRLSLEFTDFNRLRQLRSDLRYYSAGLDRVVHVPLGFETDLASVPRLPVVFFFGDIGPYAAVVHDFLYSQQSDVAVSRRAADDVLLEALEVTGVAWWRRWPMWLAVRLFGRRCWRG